MVKAVVDSYQYLSLLGQIAIVVVLFMYLGKVFFKSKSLDNFRKKIAPHSYLLAFSLTLIATLASLFLSEIMKFQPCILCWYQRVAMYPQVVMLYIALVRREQVLRPYLIVLNVLGGLVASYHYVLQIAPKDLLMPCAKELTGISISCTEGYKFYMGYMSFPLMALTVFVLLIILMLFSNAQNPKRSK